MRVLIQRTSSAEVWIDDARFSACGGGLTLFFGTRTGDTEALVRPLAEKVAHLRIFEDPEGKMNLSALDVAAQVMVVSQFTLYADCRKGRRPAFTDAQAPELARALYEKFSAELTALGLFVATGRFGAKMDVRITNHGPVTIMLEHELP